MPAISSADAATDAARRLDDALYNPPPAAPFARFGSQTMYAIQQLADIFAVTGAPTLTPTPPPRRTRTTIPLPPLQGKAYPHAPLRVPPTVPPCLPPMKALVTPPRVDPPARNLCHRYPLRSHARANHALENVGEGYIAFQGVLDP